jgi:hypothetical protein
LLAFFALGGVGCAANALLGSIADAGLSLLTTLASPFAKHDGGTIISGSAQPFAAAQTVNFIYRI